MNENLGECVCVCVCVFIDKLGSKAWKKFQIEKRTETVANKGNVCVCVCVCECLRVVFKYGEP